MSIIHYCDGCSEPMSDRQSDRIHKDASPGDPMVFEITTGIDGTWNAGDWCHACIAKAVVRHVFGSQFVPARKSDLKSGAK